MRGVQVRPGMIWYRIPASTSQPTKLLFLVKLSVGCPELFSGEPGPVHGPLSEPTRKVAGQAVFSAVQKPPAAPSRVRLSVYLYSALPPTIIQPKRSSLATSPCRRKVWIELPSTSDLPRISNHSPK